MYRSLILFALVIFPNFVFAEEESMESNEANCIEFVFYGIEGISLERCSLIVSEIISETENPALRTALTQSAENMGLTINSSDGQTNVADTNGVDGVCRVSTGDLSQIFDQEPCRREVRYCEEEACVLDFIWPSGAKTVVESNDDDVNSAFRINGQPAGLTNRMGEGSSLQLDCTLSFDTYRMFCFSKDGSFGLGPTQEDSSVAELASSGDVEANANIRPSSEERFDRTASSWTLFLDAYGVWEYAYSIKEGGYISDTDTLTLDVAPPRFLRQLDGSRILHPLGINHIHQVEPSEMSNQNVPDFYRNIGSLLYDDIRTNTGRAADSGYRWVQVEEVQFQLKPEVRGNSNVDCGTSSCTFSYASVEAIAYKVLNRPNDECALTYSVTFQVDILSPEIDGFGMSIYNREPNETPTSRFSKEYEYCLMPSSAGYSIDGVELVQSNPIYD